MSGSRVRPPGRRDDPDAWLFLTPEVEREVPSLLARLSLGAERVEEARIERLIHRGTIRSWFAYLRDVRGRLDRAAEEGLDPELSRRLALILREQYLLVPAIRSDEPQDGPELSRLEELTWIST